MIITMRHFNVAVLRTALLIGLCSTAVALAEIPAGPDVPTLKLIRSKERALTAKMVREQYAAHGLKDAKWSAAAAEFMELEAKATGFEDETPEVIESKRQGKALMDAHCNDALVQYLIGRRLVQQKKGINVERYVRDAAKAMEKQGYSGTWQAIAAHHARDRFTRRQDSGEAAVCDDLVVAGIKRAFTDHDFAPTDRPLLLMRLSDWLKPLATAKRKAVWDTVKDIPEADRVAVLYIEGLSHISAAWSARGGGWANSVTPQGWEGFGNQLALATAKLTKAWETDKTVPEPADAMITVAMGSTGAADMRMWFDRAVAARFDDPIAYHNYIYGMYPRWHGNRESLMDFAVECYNTRRFDTHVPLEYLDILMTVREECDGGDMTPWNQPEIYNRVKEILDKSLAPNGCLPGDRRNRSIEAAFCVRAGKWDDAKAAIDQMTQPLDPLGTHVIRLTPAEVRGSAFAFSGAGQNMALQAKSLAAAGKRKEAIADYETALKDQKDDITALFLRDNIQVLRWESDFRDGKEIEIKTDKDLTGLRSLAGDWTVDADGAMVGTAVNDERLNLICRADFGDSWELRAEIDFVKETAPWDVSGITLGHPESSSNLELQLNHKDGIMKLGGGLANQKESSPIKVLDQKNEIIVRRLGNKLIVSINGKEAYKGDCPADEEGHRLQIGLGGYPIYTGSIMRFHDVRIKQLSLGL